MHLPENVTTLCRKKRFSFACHSGLPCFTDCCRALDLPLTPYDVLCLCKELQLSSGEFVERFVVVEQDEEGGLPQVYLGMVDDGRASCPFISENGCRVYRSRPGACRAYPVGRGVSLAADNSVRETYVLVREEHCQGFAESLSYNVMEWFENQGLVTYNAVNDELLELLHRERQGRGVGRTDEEMKMFFNTLYRLDKFRRAVASPAFQKKYQLGDEERDRLLADDLALLRFGISWLQEVLF